MPPTRTLASTWQHPSKPPVSMVTIAANGERRKEDEEKEEVGGSKMEQGGYKKTFTGL